MATLQPAALLGALDLWDSLNPGDQVLVRFGSRGSQSAVITGRTRGGYLMGCKFRAKSHSYTGPVRIHPGDVVQVIARADTLAAQGDEPSRYRNHYECPCGEAWQDEWLCACDDKCPSCNTACSPHESEEI